MGPEGVTANDTGGVIPELPDSYDGGSNPTTVVTSVYNPVIAPVFTVGEMAPDAVENSTFLTYFSLVDKIGWEPDPEGGTWDVNDDEVAPTPALGLVYPVTSITTAEADAATYGHRSFGVSIFSFFVFSPLSWGVAE